MIELLAGDNEAGCRLDRIVRKKLPLIALSGIYSLIRKGGVRVSGQKVRQDYRLQRGDVIAIDADVAELAVPDYHERQDLSALVRTEFFKRNFTVLHEDRDLLACNKPAGLVVHPGTGHLRRDTLIDLATAYLLAGRKINGSDDVALVHRLDRDTSGVILIAKNKPAVRRLHEAFRPRSLVKQYVAICHHRPPKAEGEVAVRLVRDRDERGETKMRVRGQEVSGAAGMPTRSVYRLDAYHNDLSKVELFLETGKTHQLRVHLAHLGAPIVGDSRYGDAVLDKALFTRRTRVVQRLYLHALRLEVPGYSGGRTISIKAPLPEEFKSIMEEDRIGR